PYPYLALASVGLGWWGQIAFKGINSQKANAGITKAVLYHIRHDDGARALLGENIHHDERKHPSVKGDVNMMKGRADFDYVVEGSKSLGTVHYSG
ncbi:cytochrome oxidase assembly protein 1, partial [Phlyctochytrium arcticum]